MQYLEFTPIHFFIFALTVFCAIFVLKHQSHADITEEADIYGKLTASGWMLIVDKNDHVCKRQFEILGHIRSIIPTWDILSDRDKVIKIGARDIDSVPCWFNVFTKKHKYGVLPLTKVKRLLTKK